MATILTQNRKAASGAKQKLPRIQYFGTSKLVEYDKTIKPCSRNLFDFKHHDKDFHVIGV